MDKFSYVQARSKFPYIFHRFSTLECRKDCDMLLICGKRNSPSLFVRRGLVSAVATRGAGSVKMAATGAEELFFSFRCLITEEDSRSCLRSEVFWPSSERTLRWATAPNSGMKNTRMAAACTSPNAQNDWAFWRRLDRVGEDFQRNRLIASDSKIRELDIPQVTLRLIIPTPFSFPPLFVPYVTIP